MATPVADDTTRWSCEEDCGYTGTFAAVEAHEQAGVCVARVNAMGRARDGLHHSAADRQALGVHRVDLGGGAGYPELMDDVAVVYGLDDVMTDDIPCSFWVPAAAAAERQTTLLEELVCAVFREHTARAVPGSFDPAISGAEWWVQQRELPPGDAPTAMTDAELASSSQEWHWDKDAAAFAKTGPGIPR